jgi:hypothetical protein
MFKRLFSLGIAVLLGQVVWANSAYAATATWSGTISAAQLNTNLTCTSTGGNRNYYVQRFYVDTTGTYDLTIISASGFPSSPTDSLMFLYTPAFLPPSSSTNCIAASDDAIGLNPFISITLQANTAYDVVVLNAWSPGAPAPGGIFTGQISGPGQICFGAPCGTVTGTALVPPDSRLNWMFGDGSVGILYPGNDGAVDLYIIDTEIYISDFITPNDLAPYAGNPPAAPILIRSEGRIRVYVLSSGQIQVNFGPDDEGKLWVFVMNNLQDREAVDSYYIDPNE